MYTYRRAVGINLQVPRGEELLDISAVQTKQLFALYSDLIIVVTDSFAKRDVAIDAAKYQDELGLFVGTIQAWLNTKATVPLITSNTLPGTEYRFVTTHDIQYEWFTLLPGDARISEDRQNLLTKTSAPDIRVAKTDNTVVDYEALVKRCLWTINGHLVRAVKGDRSVYLLNAGKHFNVDDNVHVNSLNFNTVSTLNTYPIAAEQLEFIDHDTYRSLRVDLPVSLVGKTVWMSIGGRLYLNDVVQVNGPKGVTIRTEKVDWFSRIFDSKELIDLTSVIDKDRQVVGKDFFQTEEFFTKLLTDPSSFFIILDNPHLYVDLQPITSYAYPFTFHTEETRRIPLMVGNGLLPKYFTRRLINRRLLDIDIGVHKRYLNKTTGIHNEGELFHGYTNRYTPSTLLEGYLLYIRGLIQEA
jgi:hypothetical protein